MLADVQRSAASRFSTEAISHKKPNPIFGQRMRRVLQRRLRGNAFLNTSPPQKTDAQMKYEIHGGATLQERLQNGAAADQIMHPTKIMSAGNNNNIRTNTDMVKKIRTQSHVHTDPGAPLVISCALTVSQNPPLDSRLPPFTCRRKSREPLRLTRLIRNHSETPPSPRFQARFPRCFPPPTRQALVKNVPSPCN